MIMIKLIKLIIITIAYFSNIQFAFSGTLDLGKDFEAGQAAVANDINLKFQKIEDAVNLLQDQVTELNQNTVNCNSGLKLDHRYKFSIFQAGFETTNGFFPLDSAPFDTTELEYSGTLISLYTGEICMYSHPDSGNLFKARLGKMIWMGKFNNNVQADSDSGGLTDTSPILSGNFNVNTNCIISATIQDGEFEFYMTPNLYYGLSDNFDFSADSEQDPDTGLISSWNNNRVGSFTIVKTGEKCSLDPAFNW